MIPAHAIQMKKKSKADEVKRVLKHTHSEIQNAKNIHLGRRENDFIAKALEKKQIHSEKKKNYQSEPNKNKVSQQKKINQRSSTQRVLESASVCQILCIYLSITYLYLSIT